MPSTDPSPPRRPIRVAVLHLGSPRGGIQRYGRMVADGLRDTQGVVVAEHATDLAVGGPRGVLAAARAAGALGRADVSVIPYGRYGLWAGGRVRLAQLMVMHGHLRRKSVTVLHDVAPAGEGGLVEEACLRLVVRLSGAVVVHGDHERARLAARGLAHGVTQVPLLVERRALPERGEARRRLGLTDDDAVLGMVGWIHPRKNCEAAIEALALLPGRVRLALIGAFATGAGDYVERVLALADARGVRDRVTVTGYLDEEDLDRWLAAIDVGLCPYLDASASASFATLLSAHAPIVATDLPAFRTFSAPAEAVTYVERPTPERLARAIAERLSRGPATRSAPDSALHSPQSVAQTYLDRVFRQVL